jgi:hypothetical protein
MSAITTAIKPTRISLTLYGTMASTLFGRSRQLACKARAGLALSAHCFDPVCGCCS